MEKPRGMPSTQDASIFIAMILERAGRAVRLKTKNVKYLMIMQLRHFSLSLQNVNEPCTAIAPWHRHVITWY